MRSPNDPCLLCNENLATKRNSHILPKFISTGFLGDDPRRGYELDSNTFPEGKKKVIQDSPKEDYILCENCESYFGVLETIAGRDLKNWKERYKSGEYSSMIIGEVMGIIDCTTARKRAIHLFIYSLFWRSHISTLNGFANFQIENEDFERDLKNELLRFKATSQNEFLEKMDHSPDFNFFPSAVFTVFSMTDPTENSIIVPAGYPYRIMTDTFVFELFHEEKDIKYADLYLTYNLKEEDCKIIVLPENLWKDTFLDEAFKLFAQEAERNGR